MMPRQRRGLSARRILVWSSLSVPLLAVGCASLPNTPAQDLAWERWRKCGGVAAVRIEEVRPNGQISYWYKGPADRRAFDECHRTLAAQQEQRPGALRILGPRSNAEER